MKLRRTRTTLSLLVAGLVSAPSLAAVVPYTETFAADNANWGTGGDWITYDPLGWSATGGPGDHAFVTATNNFADFSPGGFPLTLFRGQDNFQSSNGAFEGDWIAGGITEFSFWVRHDAHISLTYFARFTPIGANSPSMNLFFTEFVAPNTWTKLTVQISPDNPDFVVGGGPGTYEAVFGNLGKIQLGADVGNLAGIDQDFNFDLAMVSMSVPAPGAFMLFAMGALGARRRRS